MRRVDFAFFAVASTAEGAVFWTRGFAAVTAFRRKVGGFVRQPPRRPITRALGHRADILGLIRVRSLGKQQVVLVFMLSRNKELVVQPGGSRSIEKLAGWMSWWGWGWRRATRLEDMVRTLIAIHFEESHTMFSKDLVRAQAVLSAIGSARYQLTVSRQQVRDMEIKLMRWKNLPHRCRDKE